MGVCVHDLQVQTHLNINNSPMLVVNSNVNSLYDHAQMFNWTIIYFLSAKSRLMEELEHRTDQGA